MEKKNILFVVILSLFSIRAVSQTKYPVFNLVDSIVMGESKGSVLAVKLDTLRAQFRGDLNNYFERDIDEGFVHQRIKIRLQHEDHLVDLLKRNDTIYARSVKRINNIFDTTVYASDSKIDSKQIDDYLRKRNQFYGSSKTATDLINELSEFRIYAYYCGDGLPKTEDYHLMDKLVKDQNVKVLTRMLQSFCVESQTYAENGFTRLLKEEYNIDKNIRKILKYIRKRNSPVISCSGCLVGLVEKPY